MTLREIQGPWHMCRGKGQCSPPTCYVRSGDLRSPDLCRKYLYLLSHLAGVGDRHKQSIWVPLILQSIWVPLILQSHTYHTSHLLTREQRLHTLLTLSSSRPLYLFLPWEHHLPTSCHWKTPLNCKAPWHAHVRSVSSVEDDNNYYL